MNTSKAFNIFKYLQSPAQIASDLMRHYNNVELVKAHCGKMIECHPDNIQVIDLFLDVYNIVNTTMKKPVMVHELQEY